MKKYFLAVMLICLSVFLVILLVYKPKPKAGKVLKIALPSDVSTLHFSASAKGCSINSSHVMNLLFEGLMRRGENDIPRSAVAEKVDISEDLKTYVFYLRDCYWSDGVKVSAYDFEYAWKKVINPYAEVSTQTPFFYYPIKNAKKCFAEEISCSCIGITVKNDKTLIVELEYPAPYFLELVASPQFFPAPVHIAKNDPEWASKPGIICNGPYTLEKWRHNFELVLSKNANYWDKKHVYIDNIEMYIIPHSSTVLNMYEIGELDWIGAPFMRMSHDISYKTITEQHEDALVYWLAFNTQKPILDHPKFRKALAYAIDRKSITKNVFYEFATPLMGVLPHSMSLNKHPYFQDNNHELARQYLQEALDELKLSLKDLPIIRLGYVADLEVHHRTTQAIQDQWRKVLGITNIILEPVEYNVYFDNVTCGKYEIGFMGWASHVHDPLFILNSFKKKSELINKTNWENERFKHLIDIAECSVSNKERDNLFSEAEALLMEEMPIIPICSMKKRFAKNPKLKGVKISNLQSVDLKSAYFED